MSMDDAKTQAEEKTDNVVISETKSNSQDEGYSSVSAEGQAQKGSTSYSINAQSSINRTNNATVVSSTIKEQEISPKYNQTTITNTVENMSASGNYTKQENIIQTYKSKNKEVEYFKNNTYRENPLSAELGYNKSCLNSEEHTSTTTDKQHYTTHTLSSQTAQRQTYNVSDLDGGGFRSVDVGKYAYDSRLNGISVKEQREKDNFETNINSDYTTYTTINNKTNNGYKISVANDGTVTGAYVTIDDDRLEYNSEMSKNDLKKTLKHDAKRAQKIISDMTGHKDAQALYNSLPDVSKTGIMTASGMFTNNTDTPSAKAVRETSIKNNESRISESKNMDMNKLVADKIAQWKGR